MKKSKLFICTLLLTTNWFLPTLSFAQYTLLYDGNVATTGEISPNGSLITDGTYLYGMMGFGGTNTCSSYGCGGIFKVKLDGTGYENLFDFDSIDGSNPRGSLISDGTFLYGMTSGNGTANKGGVFRIKPDGTGYNILLNFNGTNGANPEGDLIYDGVFLYGMTYQGGVNNGGVIFKIKPDGSGYSKLLDFNSDCTNGCLPIGSLIYDGDFLYGMTFGSALNEFGTIFKIKPDGTNYVKLHAFDNANGAYPHGSLFFDGTFLYGMTEGDGASNLGNIFKIKPDGTGFSSILNFNGTNGGSPIGSLISDGTFLYGVESGLGTFPSNDGSIFKIKPDGTNYTHLMNFDPATTGSSPMGSLISDGKFLYGTLANNKGKIFKYQYCNVNCCYSHYFTTYDTIQNTFTLTVDSPTSSNYNWDFGDGSTSTLVNPSHIYTSDTTYNVCLKITTASGDTCSYCHVIGKDYLGNIYRTSGFTLNVINSNLQTGITSVSSTENNFIIFPNPTNGETEILFNRSVNNITIRVFNVTGQKMVEKTSVSGNRFNIDISDQTSGVYLIEVISDDNVQRRKLIKQ